MASHPRVHIRVKVVPLDQIPNAVLTGDADIALGYNYPITPGLRVVASHDIHLGAVVAPNHPLTKRRPAWLADCLEYPLVIGDRSMTIRPIVDMAFTRAGLPLHPTIETNSIEFMSRIARAGRAVSFLNPVDVDVHTARGELVFIPFHDLSVEPVTMKLAVRARGTLDAFPSVLVEELRQAMPMLRRAGSDDE